jgi:hypothetical protein
VWRLSLEDRWHDIRELDALAPEQRRVIEALISRPGLTDTIKMSPWDVWEQGQADLVKLDVNCIPLICGPDLAVARPCPACDQIEFVDQDIHPDPMYFEVYYREPHGRERRLQEGREYLWLINPFDPRQLFVSETNGVYLGICRRCDQPCRVDMDGIRLEMGQAQKRELQAAQRLIKANEKQIRAEIARADRNTALLRGEGVTAEEQQAERIRQARLRGCKEDFTALDGSGSAQDNTDAEPYAVSMQELEQL